MWEVLLSLHQLQNRTGALVFRQWRETVRRQLPGAMRLLSTLAPAAGYSPDFLTPADGADGLDAGIDALLATSSARLRTDMRRFARSHPPTAWTRTILDGDGEALGHLGTLVRRYHDVALAPYWTRVQAAVDSERVTQTRALSQLGLEGMIASLHPTLRWHPPVLEVHGLAISRDIHLDGRGLRLIPSYFCWRQPTLLRDPTLAPVLVYPVEHRLDQLIAPANGRTSTPDHRLAPLLGRTRAAVLEAVDAGCTTTELAERVGISPASASQHASVLRDAGLITTRRLGGSVLHSLRPLGTDLLAEQAAGPR